MNNLLIAMAVAVVYYYYNWQLFRYEEEMLGVCKIKNIHIHITFLINYCVFIIMGFLGLHLCVNWTFFAVFLLLENVIIFKCPAGRAYSLAITGTTFGLAANVLFRCVFSIALNKPLYVFDNNVVMEGNIKQYPVFLGFLAAGIIFHVIRAKKLPDKIRITLEDYVGLNFLNAVQSILYIYLVLNLLGYYTEGNAFPMKMWGIKSALFSTLGWGLLITYIVYMNQLKLYQKEVMEKREELLATRKEEERTWIVAFTDTLTGCYNRQYAQEVFQMLEETGTEVVLCFVDLDGLKMVNDTYGHQWGDKYLLTAVQCIESAVRKDQDYMFRYGGDEFVLLFEGITPETVDFRIRKVQKQMQKMSSTSDLPFALSISYGIACGNEAKNLEEALLLADKRMYEQKERKKNVQW